MQQRVLVIDDTDATRRWVANLLRRRGYAVVEAPDGKTGLDALREHPDTAVIVLDLMMEANADGWWFRDQQMRDPAIAAVPVIILSVAPATEPLRYSLQAHTVLQKFPEPDEVLAAIQTAISGLTGPV